MRARGRQRLDAQALAAPAAPGSAARAAVLFTLALTSALAAAAATGCRGRGESPETGASDQSAAPIAEEPAAPTEREIVLFFPGQNDDFLHGERRTVLPIGAPEDRAKQCLEELIKGPSPPLLAAVPNGVRLRQIYLLQDGTAFADFSGEMLTNRGGTLRELQMIYAIVDTLAVNVDEIRRVGILIDGQARETLAGHVDIESPLHADYQYVDPKSRPARAPDAANKGVGGPSEPVPAQSPSGEGDASGTSGAPAASGSGGAPAASGASGKTKGDGDGT